MAFATIISGGRFAGESPKPLLGWVALPKSSFPQACLRLESTRNSLQYTFETRFETDFLKDADLPLLGSETPSRHSILIEELDEERRHGRFRKGCNYRHVLPLSRGARRRGAVESNLRET